MDHVRGMLGFVKTVEHGSFAAAARDLGITAVGVSKNVQRLEHALGVRLLQRSTRRLSITDEGRLLYEHCTGPLQALQQAQQVVRDRGGTPAGVVRVTSVSPFGRSYVLPLLPQFAALHPQVRVELDLDDGVADMIGERYDIGIRVGPLREGSAIVREIAPLAMVVCAAPAYLQARGRPATPDDLRTHNCLRLRPTGSAQAVPWVLGEGAQALQPAAAGDLVCNDITGLVTAALHGQGLVLAPLPLVLPLLRAGALVPLLPQWLALGRHVYLHYPNRRNLPARVRALVDFLLQRLRAHPDLRGDPRELVRELVAG
jgi:DNA-binding transcriptional LysR family regulator